MKPSLPRRILMTADPVGGVWTYALELAAALRHDNMRVALATMGAPLTPEQRAAVKKAGNIELHESSYKLEWMEEPWTEVDLAGNWLLELEERIRPDLIHLNGYAHAALPWHTPTVVVAHSCVLSWWRAVKREPAPRTWDHYRQRVQTGLRAADLVIAPSRAMAAELDRLYGPLAIQVIANGCDAAKFPRGKKEPLILSAGRLWDEAKNVSALAAAAPLVRWPIYVAGEQPCAPTWPLGREILHFIGRQPPNELYKWFCRASIYALPARYEPFGLSILEAALNGCALVLGDIASLRENWNEAAMFVEPDNPEHLARCLQKWIDNPSSLRNWSARAQVQAAQFTSRKMAEHYREAYAHVIAASRSDAAQEFQSGSCRTSLRKSRWPRISAARDAKPELEPPTKGDVSGTTAEEDMCAS